MNTLSEYIALAIVCISFISLFLGLFGSSKEDSVFNIWFRGIKRFFYPFVMLLWIIFFWTAISIIFRSIKNFIRA